MSPRSRRRGWHSGRWPSWLVALLSLVAMLLLSWILLSVSLRLAGSLEAHQAAWTRAGPWLLLWRGCLYLGLALVWWKRWRPRVLRRLAIEPDQEALARARLRRLEALAVGTILLLELTHWINSSGGA